MKLLHTISASMKCIFATILLLAYSILGFSQAEITVKFSGQLNGTTYQRLDSVKVIDISKGWTETVHYPDTIAILRQTNNLETISFDTDALYQNAPNPFDCTTTAELAISSQSNVNMQLIDVNGRTLTTFNGPLNAGIHKFEISAEKPQTYLLNAKVGAKSYSIRMINVGNGCGNTIKYIGYSENITAKLECENQFTLGDNMCYTGYTFIDGNVTTSASIIQQQSTDQNLTLNFSSQSTTQLAVITYLASSVGPTTATMRGYLLNGEQNTTMGFLYSTEEDYLQYNVIATQTYNQEFSFRLTDLSPNTTYYYKAYATNMTGSAYGEILSFTTTSADSPSSQPEVITCPATSVGPTSATINGQLLSGGQATLGFMYGTSPYNYNLQHNVIATQTSNYDFSYQLTDLSPNTTYYFKAYATNSIGTDDGEILSFTTTPTSSEYDIEINFSGLANNNFNTYANYFIPLDSIRIENQTRNWTRTLYYPDTTLYVNFSSGRLIIGGDITSSDIINCTGYTTYRNVSYTSDLQTITPSANINVSLRFHIPYCDDKTVVIQLQDCEPITYNGTTYNQSGMYTIGQYLTYKGCDSTVILDVRIRQHLFNEITVYTCEETYEYNGHTYTESGIYQHSFVTAHGCDSLVSLVLTLGNGFRDERDGNVYCTITYGDQVWMKENLRYLPQVQPPTNTSAEGIRYYVYGYNGTDVNEAMATENYQKYGALYNYNAAMTACPAGWHLPSDTEWTLLEIYLENNGYNFNEYVDNDNDRDTHNVIAKSMAATSGWTTSDVTNAVGWLQAKNNSSGFNGKPGGEKYIQGFQNINETAIWWTSTPNTGDNCWDRYLFFSRDFCNRTNNHRSIGMSVRCVQD
ncbi:MAG: hypothetical protein IK025_01235 [Bacteroidales bacterium]|nr:hypothetical protein [Bacteroidales bacterium]